jgi:hypothetical protein
VYAPGSVLVTPSFLRGGIKTKVLEAFAHGVPVVGNSVTFEGLDLPDYPLCLDERDALADFLRTPSSHSGAIARALKMEEECLRRDHAEPVFAMRWADAILGPRGSDPASEPQAQKEFQHGASLPARSRARASFGFNDNSSNAGLAPAAGE